MFKLLEKKGIDLILPPPPEAPQTIELVTKVFKYMKALGRLTSTHTPVQMLLWPLSVAVWVVYGLGGASQEGFGDNIKPLNLV